MSRHRIRWSSARRAWIVTALSDGLWNDNWSHWVGDFGSWEFAMWVATGDRRYRQPGYRLEPRFFTPSSGTVVGQ